MAIEEDLSATGGQLNYYVLNYYSTLYSDILQHYIHTYMHKLHTVKHIDDLWNVFIFYVEICKQKCCN